MSAWKEKSPFEAYPVALCLVGACGIIFIATDAGLLDGRFAGLKAWGRAWLPGFATGELWRPLTAMFLHGGVIHVLVNGYALMALCPSMEARVGSARFAAIYFGAGISGSLCSMGWEHASVGASGAIFGIMGAYLRLARVESGSFRGMARHPVGSQLLGWLALNLVLGFTMPGISNAGHLGGLIGGWIVSAGVLPAGGGAARGLILPVVSWPKIAAAAAFLLALAAVDLLVVAPRQDATLARRAVAAAGRGDSAEAADLARRAQEARWNSDPPSVFRASRRAWESGHAELALDLFLAGFPQDLRPQLAADRNRLRVEFLRMVDDLPSESPDSPDR